ncbi:dTDP-4-dehydrorhamnose 3,5-epimerase [Filobacillus milosensis]|uniref:dTDP-4-dehydrorhamnose 3,5-epimerase n=1 Tax=Filobacillus milosensis TaxID=94137 RepID=A0A4Y8IDW4_9BACI|nr:dTDP-4-dehydrorhamnose 3,5-epimerase [Filobacillus milosensis]TFB14182.1 dTDP-4-dehydrorhamnose 3,5-epimerase [Filobacillus milosensis]
MNIKETDLEGVYLIEPKVFGDHRGWFTESYNKVNLIKEGIEIDFIQDNHSFSANKGTLRGLHFQLNPKAQTKLVRCTKGAIFDVAVDIRKNSSNYGKWFGIELNEDNKKQLLIPKGFAHAFLTLTENVEVQYKVDEVYSPEHDRGILWNDSNIGIKWPINFNPILSEKDQNAPKLEDAENNFSVGDKT